MPRLASMFQRRRNHGPVPSSELGPSGVEVHPRRLHVGDGVCASFAITGYPAEVVPGWLEPLLAYPGRLDVSLHIEPVPPQVAADRLRKQRARLESSQRSDAEHGRLGDPEAEAAADDATQLAARLARGHGKLFRVGLYLTVWATTVDQLDEECSQVRALASSLLLDAQPATFRALQGWATTLPLGCDQLAQTRTFDTAALSAAFPFSSPDLPATGGVLYGLNTASAGLVMWDRFAQDNYNSVVLARSGAGKSYFTKLEALRSLYNGVEVCVIDPEDEYRRLTDAVGGAHIPLGADNVRLNPLDLPPGAQHTSNDALTRRGLFLHTLIAVMLGRDLDPGERAALDRAVVAIYHAAGITSDARTWNRPAPLLGDLAATLDSDADTTASELAAALAPYTTGSYRHLFAGPTTTRPESHLTAFSLQQLPDELRGVGSLLALDATWRRVTTADRPRLVIVDEAWLLMQTTQGAKWLFRLAKSARKYWTGLALVTQDAGDLLASELGQAVIANATSQVLMRQAPQAIDRVAEAFRLTDGERQYLLAAERGQALLACGQQRVGFHAIASQTENSLITTDPAELAQLTTDGADEEV